MDRNLNLTTAKGERQQPELRSSPMSSFKTFRVATSNIRFRLFALVMGLTLIAILISLAAAINSANRVTQQAAETYALSMRNQIKAHLVNDNQRMAKESALILDRAVRDIQTVADTTAAIYNGEIQLTPISADLTIGPGGQALNGDDDITSIFVPNTIMAKTQSDPVLAQAVQRDIGLSAYLDLTLKAVMENNPNASAIYLGTSNDILRHYPDIHLGEEVSADFQVTQEPWYLASLESNIPRSRQRPVWLPVKFAARGSDLVTSIAEPVYDRQGRLIGVIGLDITLDELQSNIENARFLKNGYSFLFDKQGNVIILPEQGYKDLFGRAPDPANPLPNLLEKDTQGEITSQNSNELERILGNLQHGETGFDSVHLGDKEFYIAYSPATTANDGSNAPSGGSTDPGWFLASVVPVEIVLQEANALQQELEHTTQIGIFRKILPIGILVALITMVLAWLGANWLVRPIRKLAISAEELETGEYLLPLTTLTEVQNQYHDEIGWLAGALGSMAKQIKQTIDQLEHHLAEQTHQLKYRSLQLQTTVAIAREISLAQDLDSLLQAVVDLINERFGYYNVCIFLVDELGEYAKLSVASGEMGSNLRQSDVRLRVGQQGMVGFVTRFGLPRLSGDVHSDNMYVASPLLPDTRSELTVPLQRGSNIIGALDVQSIQPAAFTQDDLTALQSMADQLSTAIENMRLVSQVQTALTETSQIAQYQTLENWSRLFANQGPLAYEYDLLEIRQVMQPGEAITCSKQKSVDDLDISNPTQRGWFQVPVKLRDQVIGTIIIESQDSNHIWNEDEITIVKATANQAALTVENARLLAESQHKAQREQLISEVTSNLRASLDMETVLKTAVQEIGQRLGIAQVEIRLNQVGELVMEKTNHDNNSPTGFDTPASISDKNSGGNGRVSDTGDHLPGLRSAYATE